jgi:microcystin-dependent protein
MLLSIPNPFVASTRILSASVNANFSAIASWANGGIADDNLDTFTGPISWTISGNQLAISIGSASTTGIYVASLTGVLASTKSAFDLQSSSAQTTGRALAYLSLSNGSSTIPAMLINNVGTGIGLSITQSGAGSGLKVAQSANAIGVEVTNSGTSSGLKVTQSGNGVAIEAVNSGTASGVKVTDSGTGTAALEVVSTTKGFLPPRMTYAQRNSISSPAEGLEIYNTDSKCKQVYTGSEWVNIGTPVGGVVASAGTTAPAGFLASDGSAISRTTYAELFAKIGTSHGQGDNSTTFNLPDYRGRFLRGVANGQSTDPDRASRTAMATGGNTGDNVGSVQSSQYGSHDHGGGSYATSTHKHTLPIGSDGGNNFYTSNNGSSWDFGQGNRSGSFLTGRGSVAAGSPGTISAPLSDVPSATGTISANGGNETRPVNANVNFFIKF